MKKIIYVAVAVAATVACSKIIETMTLEIDTPNAFVKGQKVTLTVSAEIDTRMTKAGSELNSDGQKIDFKWQMGDKIKVSIGGNSEEFTLKSGAGTSNGTFEGTMPDDGDSFDVQYPCIDPDISTQYYSSAETIPHDEMKLSGSSSSTSFTLTAANAVLRLNLYGIERKVSQIKVTDTSSEADQKPSYTLNVSPAVTISSDKDSPSSFFIVVPAGESAWNFKTELTSEAVTPSTYTLPKYPTEENPRYGPGILIVNGTFSTSSAQSFSAGDCLNMPAVSLTTVWAPVNCGYEPATKDPFSEGYPYGKYYQWGRMVGGGFNASEGVQTPVKATWDPDGYNNNPDDNKFYYTRSKPYIWYTNDISKQLSAWPLKVGDSGYVEGKIANPCPDGWRVPTQGELKALIGTNSAPSIVYDTHGESYIAGCKFDGGAGISVSNYVFLPISGWLNFDGGEPLYRGTYGTYWSTCTANMVFYNGGASAYDYSPLSMGFSVRCIKE